MEEKDPKNSQESGILKTTAAALGGAAGTIAALAKSVTHTGTHAEGKADTETTPTRAPEAERGKFAKKNKLRLPRKEKKALAKKAGGVIA